jgi:hypothetical protein
MRRLINSTVAGLAMLAALGTQACNDSEPTADQKTEETKQAQSTCHHYTNGNGDSCSLCYNWHWEADAYGSWKELDSYSDLCD